MKTNLKSAALLAFVLLLSFGCEKEEEKIKSVKGINLHVAKPGYEGRLDAEYGVDNNNVMTELIFLSEKIPEAKVSMYASYNDYLQNINAVASGMTDNEGKIFFEINDFNIDYFYRIEKGDLNEKRYAYDESTATGSWGFVSKTHYEQERVTYEIVDYYQLVTKTPTKLAFRVFHQGLAIEGAEVQLYFSEEDYLNNLPAQQNKEELLASYGYWTEVNENPYDQYMNKLKQTFSSVTDENGYVLLENLEPRQYWFRISKGELSNEGGQINLSSPLPDNADLTTQLDIGIN